MKKNFFELQSFEDACATKPQEIREFTSDLRLNQILYAQKVRDSFLSIKKKSV